jgi:hypothetical protein
MLKNLHVLNLSRVEGLQSSLHELGDLIQLKELDLSGTEISSLQSVGKLKNLTRLDLSSMKQLDSLPDEISDLHKLEILNLSYSSISSLPDSLPMLKNLQVLKLCGTAVVYSTVPNEILLDFVRQCPLLGCFGDIHDHIEGKPTYTKLDYALSLNRAKSRVIFHRDDTISFPTALWPSIMSNAEVAFRKYEFCDDFCDCGGGAYDGPLDQSDAIFCLLVERGAKDVFFQQG